MTSPVRTAPTTPSAPSWTMPLPTAVAVTVLVLVLLVAAALDALAIGIGMTAMVGVGLLLVTRPDMAAYVAIALVFTNATVVAVRLHGAPGMVAAVVPLLLAVTLGYRVFVRREPVVALPQLPWLILLLFAHLISTLFAADLALAADGTVTFVIEGLILFLLFTNAVRDRTVLVQAVWVLLISGAFLGALGTIQQVTGSFDDDYLGFAQVSNAVLSQGEGGAAVEGEQPRLAGPIGEKNHYAQYMLMLAPLGLMLAWSEHRRTRRLIAIALTVFILLGVVLTFSRGAAVGMGAVLLMMAVLGYVRIPQLVTVGSIVLALLLLFPQYTQRLATLDIEQAQTNRVIMSRATENVAAALVFLDHPAIGVGPNHFPRYYREYAQEFGALVRASDRESHNLILGMAAELGAIGLFAFMGILASIATQLMRARRRWKHRDPLMSNLASGFLLALVAFVASGMFLHLSYARYFWLVAALAAATAAILLARERPPLAEDVPSGLA